MKCVAQDIRPIFDRIQDEETAIMTAKLMADRYALGEAKLDAWELAVHRASDWMAAEANDVYIFVHFGGTVLG